METPDQMTPSEAVPDDLLGVIRRSGVLGDRQFEEVDGKVRSGEYPTEAQALAERLVAERVLTEFQAGRLLRNKAHGLVVGRYVILDRLGEGNRGRVFKAQHRLMGRLAAIKVIAPRIASRASSIARFYREMRLIGRLDHPNVVRAFDADQVGDLLYIVMEYVAGESLDQVLKDRGPLPAIEVADYMAQAAQGLVHAHERGIVHRDIKPSNLLLGEGGRLKVLDLGLSALMEADSEASFATAAGRIVGTVHYMSPEQAIAQPTDGRSDLYSLGCTMYQLLSGRLPFQSETLAECLALRLRGGPTPITQFRPDLSPGLVGALEKLMARQPADRFLSAAEAAEALRALAEPEAGARPATRPGPSPSASVPQPVASPGQPATVAPPSQGFRALAAPAPNSTWSDWVTLVAARSPVFAVLTLLFELAVFVLGFVLGHLLAFLER